jgi:hypothetical protein
VPHWRAALASANTPISTPLPRGVGADLLVMQGAGMLLLALTALTLARVGPAIQALIDKVAGQRERDSRFT